MESEVVLTHQPCPDCGSSDALTVYTDHTFCFSCETHHNGTGDTPKEHPKALKGTIHPQDMTFEALSKRGITQTTCRKYGYYVTTYNGDPCQVACYCDDSGNIIGQKLRFADLYPLC